MFRAASRTPPTLHETEVRVEIAGSTMRAIDVGEGDVVVLGHSYLWDAEMWRPQITVLSKRYRVIVPELWGHGGSGPLPADALDLRDIARHHLALLDHLGIERFALVGLSVGGMWGAELALAAPERVTALALMDTFLGAEPEESRRRYLGLLDVIDASRAMPDGVLDAVVPLFFSPRVPAHLPARLRQQLAGWDSARLRDSVVPLGRMTFGRRDMLGDLFRLSMPRLVMTGSSDLPRPVHEGRRMAKALRCRFVELPGAGHISPLEAPRAVNTQLLRFLGGSVPTGAGRIGHELIHAAHHSGQTHAAPGKES